MYARDVGDRTLNFGVSGMLWEGSLIMVDRETESLWSHLLGEAMRGPLTGKELEIIPALMTDWETWKSRHPDTTAVMMPRTANRYRRGMINNRRAFGICLALDDKSKIWPLPLDVADDKARENVVNDELGDRKLLIYFDSHSETAAIYGRVVNEKPLTFSFNEGDLRDEQTQSTWDPIRGVATDGPLEGEQLTSLPGMISEASVWSLYHPESQMYRSPELAK